MKISTQELLIVLAIIVLIFGPTQIPKLKKMFKKSAKEFNESMKDDKDDDEE